MLKSLESMISREQRAEALGLLSWRYHINKEVNQLVAYDYTRRNIQQDDLLWLREGVGLIDIQTREKENDEEIQFWYVVVPTGQVKQLEKLCLVSSELYAQVKFEGVLNGCNFRNNIRVPYQKPGTLQRARDSRTTEYNEIPTLYVKGVVFQSKRDYLYAKENYVHWAVDLYLKKDLEELQIERHDFKYKDVTHLKEKLDIYKLYIKLMAETDVVGVFNQDAVAQFEWYKKMCSKLVEWDKYGFKYHKWFLQEYLKLQTDINSLERDYIEGGLCGQTAETVEWKGRAKYVFMEDFKAEFELDSYNGWKHRVMWFIDWMGVHLEEGFWKQSNSGSEQKKKACYSYFYRWCDIVRQTAIPYAAHRDLLDGFMYDEEEQKKLFNGEKTVLELYDRLFANIVDYAQKCEIAKVWQETIDRDAMSFMLDNDSKVESMYLYERILRSAFHNRNKSYAVNIEGLRDSNSILPLCKKIISSLFQLEYNRLILDIGVYSKLTRRGIKSKRVQAIIDALQNTESLKVTERLKLNGLNKTKITLQMIFEGLHTLYKICYGVWGRKFANKNKLYSDGFQLDILRGLTRGIYESVDDTGRKVIYWELYLLLKKVGVFEHREYRNKKEEHSENRDHEALQKEIQNLPILRNRNYELTICDVCLWVKELEQRVQEGRLKAYKEDELERYIVRIGL